MRIVRRIFLPVVAGLVVAALPALNAGAAAQPPAWIPIAPAAEPAPRPVVGAADLWVQPPAWVPIAAETPTLPVVVHAAHLWVQPPAWIPIATRRSP